MRIVLRGGAEIIGLALGVFSTLWVSRIVGPTFFGYYAVTLTVVAFGSLLINAGLPTVGSQRIANRPSAAGQVIWAVTISRAALATLAIAGGLFVLAVAPIDRVLADYLRVGLLLWALLPFSDVWVLVAHGRLRTISIIRVAGSTATLLAAVLLVHDISDAGRVMWVTVIGTTVTAACSSLAAYRWSPFRRPIDAGVRSTILEYLRAGLHYFKADVSAFIFTSSDRLFLYVFATPAAVGLYAAAYNIIQPFYLISTIVGDTMYRPLAESFGTDRLGATFRRYVDLMCFATIPLGFFLLAFSPFVVALLYGTKYAGASEVLVILGWVITFGYTSGITVIPFSAWNLPREYGNAIALGGAINLGLNLALIPPFEGIGAAWATVAAKIAVTVAGVRYFRRVTDYPVVRDFAEYFGIAAAAYAAALLAGWVLPYPNVTGIVSFGLVYVGLVALVRWRRYRPISTGVPWPRPLQPPRVDR